MTTVAYCSTDSCLC